MSQGSCYLDINPTNTTSKGQQRGIKGSRTARYESAKAGLTVDYESAHKRLTRFTDKPDIEGAAKGIFMRQMGHGEYDEN